MRSYIYKQSSVIGSQAEHAGMRTYYFSADTQEDMNTWLKAMNQAALMQNQADTLIRWGHTHTHARAQHRDSGSEYRVSADQFPITLPPLAHL